MDITQKAHNCLWNMERGRIRAAPIQTRTLQRERSHHRYMNTKLPYKRVYRGPTFTEAESGSRQLHDPGWKTKEHEFRPDIKQPNMRLGVNIDSTKHLLKMIVTDLQTPRLVEEYGFRHFMKALNPIIDVKISVSAIRKELVNIYDYTKSKVKNAVKNAKDPVLSAELWISSKEESYLTVTCHFIDKKWELKSYTLATAQLLGEHTPENVHRQLWRITTEWEIAEKIQVVVINVDGMKKVRQIPNWTYIPCFSHTLNKVILEVVETFDWKYLLRRCRHIVQFFHQENEASCSPHLTQSSCVDWLSTLKMVENICNQWSRFSQVSSYKHAENLWLNENERKLLENIMEALTVVKVDTQSIGKRGYVPVSNIIPLLDNLQLSLQSLIQQDNKVALRISERCKHHFGNINQNIWFTVSTALDPRFKRSALKTDGWEKVKTKIKEEMCKQANIGTSNDCQQNISCKMDYEYLFLRYATKGDVSAIQSPLQYWEATQESKDLSTVAHKYLSVISTAIPIERMMHEEKSQTLFNRRKCLELEDINMMLFLNSNYQKI